MKKKRDEDGKVFVVVTQFANHASINSVTLTSQYLPLYLGVGESQNR